MPSPTEAAAKSKRFFSFIVTTLINKIFLAAKNDGERGLLDKTSDTGHSGHTDDNTGGWFHSQNILHVTFLGLVLIL